MKTLDHANLTDPERRCVQEVAEVLKAELPITRIVLFGSKARGTARSDSDIDLLVLTSRPVGPQLRREVSSRLFDISLQTDIPLSAVVASEHDWSEGVIRHLLIHSEVERDGCEV